MGVIAALGRKYEAMKEHRLASKEKAIDYEERKAAVEERLAEQKARQIDAKVRIAEAQNRLPESARGNAFGRAIKQIGSNADRVAQNIVNAASSGTPSAPQRYSQQPAQYSQAPQMQQANPNKDYELAQDLELQRRRRLYSLAAERGPKGDVARRLIAQEGGSLSSAPMMPSAPQPATQPTLAQPRPRFTGINIHNDFHHKKNIGIDINKRFF